MATLTTDELEYVIPGYREYNFTFLFFPKKSAYFSFHYFYSRQFFFKFFCLLSQLQTKLINLIYSNFWNTYKTYKKKKNQTIRKTQNINFTGTIVSHNKVHVMISKQQSQTIMRRYSNRAFSPIVSDSAIYCCSSRYIATVETQHFSFFFFLFKTCHFF